MTRSKTNRYSLIICLGVCLSLCLLPVFSGSAMATDKIIKWRCQCPLPSTLGYFKEAVTVLSERVKQRSNGRFIIEMYGAGSIMPDQELLSGVKRGVLQMVGACDAGYWPGDFPLGVIAVGVPGGFRRPWELLHFYENMGFERMMRDYMKEKHDIYFMTMSISNIALCLRRPIQSLDDLKGMKLRSFSYMAKALKNLGASTVYVPMSEVYTGLSTGVFDGAHIGGAFGENMFGLFETCKYFLQPDIAIGMSDSWFVNAKAFDKLPKDLQQILQDAMKETRPEMIGYQMYNEYSTQYMIQKEKGVKIITLSPDDQEKLTQASMAVWDEMAGLSPENAKAINMMKDFLKGVGRL